MRAKSLVLLVVALGCGMVAAVAVSKAVMDQGAGEPAETTVEIYVAKKNVEAGWKLTDEHFVLDRWPQSRLPEGALVKLEQVDGMYVKQNIFAGEPIIERKISDKRDSLSTELPAGYRVFDIASGGIGYIKPGDHVDVIGTFKLEGNGNVAESRTVMRNVKVFAINGVTTRESDGKQTSGQAFLQLQVKESQVEALTLANKLGEMRISLRPFGEDSVQDGGSEADNGESFVSWVNQKDREPEPVKNSTPVNQQAPIPHNTTQVATKVAPKVAPKEAPNEMLIVTPTGIARYQWRGNNEVPKLVNETEKQDEDKPAQPAQAPAAWPFAPGNVYSGFGGYTPTYPNGGNAPVGGMPGATLGPGVPSTDSNIMNATEPPKVD